MRHYFDTILNAGTGRPLVGAQVRVLEQAGLGEDAGDVATIYSDENGTVGSNPLTVEGEESSSPGLFQFYATDGFYTIQYLYLSQVIRSISDVDISADMSAAQLADATGSGLIGFTQDSSFAVPTTVQNREREWKFASDVSPVDGIADDTESFYGFAQEISSGGGGMIWLPSTAILRLTSILPMPQNVRLCLNGARMLLDLAANGSGFDPGFRPGSGCGVYDGYVQMDSNPTGIGSQGGQHAVFTVGPMYGEGGTAASPSPLHDTQDWFFRNLILTSNADGKPMFQLMGGVRNGAIDHITVDDNSTCSGVVQADWGSVGDIDTSGGGDIDLTYAAIVATRSRFDDGLAWTTHPHAISISRIFCGTLSHASSRAVRLAGCYGIDVSRVEIAGSSESAITVTGGDPGQEFMLAADVPNAMKNTVIEGVLASDCGNGSGFREDSGADNVRVATTHVPPYEPRFPTTFLANVVLRDSTFAADGSEDVVDGATISYANGTRLENNIFTGFRHGIDIGNGAKNVTAVANTTSGCRENGQRIDGATESPEDCAILRAVSYGNGTAVALRANIWVGDSKRTEVSGCKHGKDGEADTAAYGIRCTTGAVGAKVVDNHCRSTKASTGIGYSMLGGTDFNILGVFRGNTWDVTYTVQAYGGVTAIPVQRYMSEDDRLLTLYKMDASVTPTGLALGFGDIIEYTAPAIGGIASLECTTAGTVGSGAVTVPKTTLGGAVAVASLPAASAALRGVRSTVNDSNAALTAGIGAVVAGGGANTVPVFCDSANWRIG